MIARYDIQNMIDVKKDRNKHLGGSDTAVYGLNPFKSSYALWEELTGLRPREDFTNASIEFGNEAEPVISSCIEHLYESYSYSPNPRVDGMFRGHADALSINHVIEFKTSKTTNRDRYTEAPPINYWLQVQRYMSVFGKVKADIWFYFATPKQLETLNTKYIKFDKLVKHEIERNLEAICLMNEIATDFWRYVQSKEPPLAFLEDNKEKIKELKEIYKMDILEKLGVKSLSETYRPRKSMIVYGKSGTGKTTFATKDGNALVLDINEHGAGVATSGNVVEIKNWEHLKAVLQNLPALKEQLGFDTLVIETLGKLRDVALATVLAQNGRTKAQIQDYGDTAKMIKEMVEYAIKLQDTHNFHFVMTGHESISQQTDVNGATINPTVSVDVQQAIQSSVTTSVDIIAHAVIEKQVREDGTEMFEHIIDITPSELYVTKARTKNNITLETTKLANASVKKLVSLVETGKVGQ